MDTLGGGVARAERLYVSILSHSSLFVVGFGLSSSFDAAWHFLHNVDGTPIAHHCFVNNENIPRVDFGSKSRFPSESNKLFRHPWREESLLVLFGGTRRWRLANVLTL